MYGIYLAGMAARNMQQPSSGIDKSARSRASRAEHKQVYLEHQVERLLMITESLWEMMKEQHGYTDDDLTTRVQNIDLRDGKLDGKVSPESKIYTCSNCKRKLSNHHVVCIYCGTMVKREVFER